jgi:DNA-binding Lrp family transcriptional regulator
VFLAFLRDLSPIMLPCIAPDNPLSAPWLPDLDIASVLSVENNQLDEVDRQIIHAVLAYPRAPFRTIAEAVGVSDQTVARRYRRLSEAAGLRVYGVVDSQQAGWVDWLVRLQTTPGSSHSVADALARRPDTRWVRIFSGGTEIFCVLQARTPEQRNALFLHGLPGSRRVVQISAHSILHTFTAVEWPVLANALSGAQLAKLPVAPPQDAGNADGIRPEDEPLLAELARDGRVATAALAAAIHWHESTVRRRVEELQRAGLLYFDVDIDDTYLGITVAAMLWLSVETAHLDAAGRALAEHPEVPFAAATTGRTNLAASALFRDAQHLYDYLTTRLTGLPGVQSVETAPIIGTLKRTGPVGQPRPR